ncbi:phosphohistidine phosphatase SixA [Peredibacter starrii]|uniref:Phosphohistidine phosphatase SixA n=1 Tax=Peredibacter starrii TaxID=28202 RepID=A0AAX4HLS8_9BACT|nr:phosphohistidine phosphatase SixA [Peredibacter starrii]WPU64127.1 phosphohistidine phosphatase SixA [Peredibacter starrii]
MKLIFVRHGTAEDKKKNQTEMDDFKRRLTKDGAQEVKEMVHSLHFIFRKIDVIYTSPLFRAVQTANIVYSENHKSEYEILTTLDPFSTPKEFKNSINDLDTDGVYCFVGHEPLLSQSMNYLLNKNCEIRIELEKGGVAVLAGESLEELKLTTILSPRMVTKLDF